MNELKSQIPNMSKHRGQPLRKLLEINIRCCVTKSFAIYQVGTLYLFHKESYQPISLSFMCCITLTSFNLIYGMSFLSVLKSQPNSKTDNDKRMGDLLALETFTWGKTNREDSLEIKANTPVASCYHYKTEENEVKMFTLWPKVCHF